jgi:hypothetical protein
MEINISSDERLRSYYEECFENDLNEEGESESENENEDGDLLLIIQQKKAELNEMNSKTDLNIQIEGWNDLLNSIIIQEKEYNFDIMTEFSQKKDDGRRSSNDDQEVLKNLRSEDIIKLEDFEKTIIQEIEISDEVRDVMFGMIDSVEYICSLEFDKDFSSNPLKDVCVVEKPAFDLKDFDENSFESSIFQNPLPATIESKNISDELLKSETKHQEVVQVCSTSI